MLLSAIRDEFVFHCQTRKLSPRTIRNYEKQIDYLLRFLHDEHGISVIDMLFINAAYETSINIDNEDFNTMVIMHRYRRT